MKDYKGLQTITNYNIVLGEIKPQKKVDETAFL